MTQSVTRCIPTQSVGTIIQQQLDATPATSLDDYVQKMVDHSQAPRGNASRDAPRSSRNTDVAPDTEVTQSVTRCIPTQSVGTIIQQQLDATPATSLDDYVQKMVDHSHAPRGNASRDAPRSSRNTDVAPDTEVTQSVGTINSP